MDADIEDNMVPKVLPVETSGIIKLKDAVPWPDVLKLPLKFIGLVAKIILSIIWQDY